MPPKGHAFDKFVVNTIYKDDKRKQAVASEAVAVAARAKDELLQTLCCNIEKSDMDAARKTHACMVMGIACERLRRGENPLGGLSPPSSCAACAGNPHRTHHFLCLSRKLEPGAAERSVRKSSMAKLRAAWQEHQYDEKVNVNRIEPQNINRIEPADAPLAHVLDALYALHLTRSIAAS